MMTDAVQIATLVDPSEQHEKFDSLVSHTDKCERNSLINNDQSTMK